MPFEITLPALSAGMEDAIVARWLKPEGAAISKGDPIAEIETDKATMELQAEADGTLGRIVTPDGMRATVGQVIGLLLLEGERSDQLQVRTARAASAATAAAEPVRPVPAGLSAVGDRRHVRSSPLARRLAAEHGVSLSDLTGSGPGGRIVRLDVEQAARRAPVHADAQAARDIAKDELPPKEPDKAPVPAGIAAYQAIPLSSMRRTIARRLSLSKATVPHFYLATDCNLDALLALRSDINQARDSAGRISVNDFVVKACAVALRQVPEANVIWAEDSLLKLLGVDIAVAVATKGGLITPIVRAADTKSLGAISAEIKSLASRARVNGLKPDDYQGGGFTVSNLGMYGVSSFAAIINPPQSAILAVGAGQRRPIEKDETLAFATIMTCTLSVDHRAVDGACGAELLAAFKVAIENPMAILV